MIRLKRAAAVADDAGGARVFHRAQVELAFRRRVFGDVDEPQLVESPRGEVAFDEIVMDGRTGPALQASLARVQRPDPLLRTQPCDPVLAGGDPASASSSAMKR